MKKDPAGPEHKEQTGQKEQIAKEESPSGIVQPMIDELSPRPGPPEPLPEPPPKPAELDQDPGGGYNRDHTDIQT